MLLALLRDAEACKYVFEVPHNGEQKDRFTGAMRAWNEHIRIFGQPEFMHFCSKCVCRIDKDDNTTSMAPYSIHPYGMPVLIVNPLCYLDYIDAIVTDGIEMGRPCYTVCHCTEELLMTQDQYCPSHRHLAQ